MADSFTTGGKLENPLPKAYLNITSNGVKTGCRGSHGPSSAAGGSRGPRESA